ncbi:MAG: hypothetical protein ACFE91_06425 [Promethearchaeota archaeon]
MSEGENEDKESMNEERKKLNEMGLNNTWNILTNVEKKKKQSEDKPTFRGFK